MDHYRIFLLELRDPSPDRCVQGVLRREVIEILQRLPPSNNTDNIEQHFQGKREMEPPGRVTSALTRWEEQPTGSIWTRTHVLRRYTSGRTRLASSFAFEAHRQLIPRSIREPLLNKVIAWSNFPVEYCRGGMPLSI